MKQKDIERVMAAAWAAAESVQCHGAETRDLRDTLREVDPHGVYRPGAPMAGMDCQSDFVTLRESPRYIRPADEAGSHD